MDTDLHGLGRGVLVDGVSSVYWLLLREAFIDSLLVLVLSVKIRVYPWRKLVRQAHQVPFGYLKVRFSMVPEKRFGAL